MLRLLPAVRSAASRIGLLAFMALESLAIVATSFWLNDATLAGAAAVEQHPATTVQEYQNALERANAIAVSAQGFGHDVACVRTSFEDLGESGGLGRAVGSCRAAQCPGCCARSPMNCRHSSRRLPASSRCSMRPSPKATRR